MLENPTVAVLERSAEALVVPITEFVVQPGPDDPLPQPLPGGRRAGRSG